VLFPDPDTTQAANIVAISRLAVSYSDAICRGQVDEAVLVYATDGVLASGTTADAVGHEAIATTIKEATKEFEFCFQTTHLGLVEVTGDTAWARFPITEWAKLHDGRAIQFLGIYEDQLARGADGWRFTRRFLHGLSIGRLESFTNSRTHPLAPPHTR
jgi:ketosteroid isomerase-like protein